MAKKKAAEVDENPTPRRNPEAALSRDDVVEIAAENSRLKRTLGDVAAAVGADDIDGAAEALENAGIAVPGEDDDD